MFELKSYLLSELKVFLHTGNRQNTNNKLRRYGVEYTIHSATARSRNPIYEITKITDPFKLYCVFDLGFSPNTDFTKLRDFLFFLFGDPDFRWRPMEMMEEYLRMKDHGISRQTISNYIEHLEELGLFCEMGDIVYYRVYKYYGVQKHEIVSKEAYSAAWKVYWECRADGYNSRAAYQSMYNAFKGVPRKQTRIIGNAFHYDELNKLNEYVCESFLADYGSQE